MHMKKTKLVIIRDDEAKISSFGQNNFE